MRRDAKLSCGSDMLKPLRNLREARDGDEG
jgi:hypothetical protein